MIALRSVWVGGVCNFMLVKKQAFQAASVKKGKQQKNVLHMFVSRMYVCACLDVVWPHKNAQMLPLCLLLVGREQFHDLPDHFNNWQ